MFMIEGLLCYIVIIVVVSCASIKLILVTPLCGCFITFGFYYKFSMFLVDTCSCYPIVRSVNCKLRK